MATFQAIRELFSSSEATGSRSTALQTIVVVFTLLLSSTLLAALFDAPPWLVVALAVGSGVGFLVFLGSFAYLLWTNPDALRSERFTLQKMAIERGMIGDSIAGLVSGSTQRPKSISGSDDDA